MRNLMILYSLVLVLACSPKGEQNDVRDSSENVPSETLISEASSHDSAEQELPSQEEPLPPTTSEETASSTKTPEPVVPAKRRYRHGGGKVRKGARALELKKAVNGAGKRVTLESYKAPVLVLTFGASWCAPCKKELPALEKLARSYSPKDVAFVAVNIDSTIATGKAFMKRSGLGRVKAVYDPKNLNVQSYDPPTMPSVFIINDGIVKHLHTGYHSGDERKLKKAIDREVK